MRVQQTPGTRENVRKETEGIEKRLVSFIINAENDLRFKRGACSASTLKKLGVVLQNVGNTSEAIELITVFRVYERAMDTALARSDYAAATLNVRECCEVLKQTEDAVLFPSRQRFAERLLQSVRAALRKLVHTDELVAVCSLVNILPSLSGEEEGIDFISAYFRNSIDKQLSLREVEGQFSQTVAVVFSTALQLVTSCFKSLLNHFDTLSLRVFVQESCSHTSNIISDVITKFVYDRSVEAVTENNVDEFVLVSRACTVFWRELSSELHKLNPSLEQDLCHHQDGREELLSIYVSAEIRLFRSHVSLVFHDESHYKEVSRVHDLFYVLRRSIQRAYASTSSLVFSCIVNEVGHVLFEMILQLKQSQQHPSRESFVAILPDLGTRILLNERTIDDFAHQPEVSRLLSMGLFSDTVATLGADLLNDLTVGIYSDIETKKESESLYDSIQCVGAAVDSFAKLSAETMLVVSQDFVAIMKNISRELALSQYVLSESQFETAHTQKSWVDAILWFCEQFYKVIQQRYSCISSVWVAKLTQSLIKRIAITLDLTVFNYLRFNQLGALVFERQLRALVVGLSCLGQPSARIEFSKLLSACRLLSIDGAFDVIDYFDASSGTFLELSAVEVQEVLNLRTDFEEGVVQKVFEDMFVNNNM